jgi:5-methylcytosine-specific restriction protein A
LIPRNITHDHIIKALKQIDEEGIPNHRQSTKHNLLYQDKLFPPKLVLSKANIYANGKELDPSVFSGGDETNTYLSALGWEIVTEQSLKRNPPWQRDELILALDLYFRYPLNTLSPTHLEVVNLSEILNKLPIHTQRPDKEKFRNPNGVSMKLRNFSRFDSTFPGRGLSAGGKLEEIIWREFHSDKAALQKLANNIVNSLPLINLGNTLSESVEEEEEEFPEGKILYRLHRRRERSKQLVQKAKDKRKKEVDVLNCDVCGFNFLQFYGDIGADYIECHHTKPVSELEDNGKTKIQDLALVCANCHKMLHRKRPWLSIEQLKQLLQRQL